MTRLLTRLRQQAEAIAKYSSLFRRSEGLYLSYPHEDTIEDDFLDALDGRKFDLVVCSDAQAILGIGDQGVGVSGASLMQIIHHTDGASIGYWCACHESYPRYGIKVPLLDFHRQGSHLQVRVGARFSRDDSDNNRSLVGGIDPARTLAVTLDVGTDNEDLLKDELYVVRVTKILNPLPLSTFSRDGLMSA